MALIALLAIFGGAISSTVGLFMITPMTAGWLGCGIAAGLCWAFITWGVTLNGFDSYMESIMWLTMPVSILLCLFSLWCLSVFVWRGIGLHVTIGVT